MSLSMYFHYTSHDDAIVIYGDRHMYEGGQLQPRHGYENLAFDDLKRQGSGKIASLNGQLVIRLAGPPQLRLVF